MTTSSLVIEKVRNYFLSGIDPVRFPLSLRRQTSVVLSGSCGWDIPEGMDEMADWDIHAILSPTDYDIFIEAANGISTIDDNEHVPRVFVQVRSTDWLKTRLGGNISDYWPMYLWIYTRCTYIQDSLEITELVNQRYAVFTQELPDLIRDYFVRFSVRRLDASSSAKRDLITAARISCGEMVKAALQTFSLLKSEPFPYNKWLARHVARFGYQGEALCKICDNCLASPDTVELNRQAKVLRDFIEATTKDVVGNQRWISRWWEFNEN